QKATLAGGCFWGVAEPLRAQPGGTKTTVGYTGGDLPNARYEDVKTGRTGHAESLEIEFDPEKTSYDAILDFFFSLHDPTTAQRQGNDIGSQYRSAIFVHDESQREAAKKAIERAQSTWPRPIVTEVVDAKPFWPAEEYHQDYLQKHPNGYTCHYVRY